MNGGSGFEVSMGDTARMIAEVMGSDIEIQCDEQRLRPGKSEVERLWADNTRLCALTGWQPRYAGLEGFKRGLEKTAQWFVKPENLASYKSGIYNI
jgi:Nucleoside-diphosphate-sugar epimerases